MGKPKSLAALRPGPVSLPVSQDHDSDNSECLCDNYNSESHGRRRRLVVAFDGTQNQFGRESSNVVEFYSRIVKSGDQLSYYNSGVGTFVKPSSSMRHMRMWIKNQRAAALGLNFKSNLLSGYRFLSDKYEKGDQIFLLGFSRGAYQARVLAAMITKVGLLRTGNNEQIPFAFKMYTDPKASVDEPVDDNDPTGEQTNTANEFKEAFCHDVKIHFVGVWDTVSSVGAFRNKYYPGAEKAEKICFFRHALALDERRVKFIPEYIFAEKEFFSAGESGSPRCKEVWFRGSHSDIGGGKVKNRTSDNGTISSRWMAYEAMLAGLEMTPFQGGFTVGDLVPKIGRRPMKRFYMFLEYMPFIKWENHSEGRPPLLDVRLGVTDQIDQTARVDQTARKELRTKDDFIRACHRKRPRQIYGHQKLHSSVCLDDGPIQNAPPFALLPESSWPEWPNILEVLRDKELVAELEAISAYYDLKVHPLASEVNPGTRAVPGPVTLLLDVDPTLPPDKEDGREIVKNEPAVANVLPPEAIEFGILDCDIVPVLIAGVRRGTNVDEFLGRLGVLACTKNGRVKIRADNQFSSMLRQVHSNESYADFAIQVAYLVFWHPEVDLYASDEELWKTILSWVQRWNRSTDTPSEPLHMAGQLVHRTNSNTAFFAIENAIIEIFNDWQRNFTKDSSALVQLRVLLPATMEYNSNVQDSVLLPLAVLASPYISDARFKEALLKRFVNIIVAGGETGKRAMLYFCVLLCATDYVTLDMYSFYQLEKKFVGPMREMWSSFMPETFDSQEEWKTSPTLLKNLLQIDHIKDAFRGDDLSWALLALDRALDPRITLQFEFPSASPEIRLKLIAEGQEGRNILPA